MAIILQIAYDHISECFSFMILKIQLPMKINHLFHFILFLVIFSIIISIYHSFYFSYTEHILKICRYLSFLEHRLSFALCTINQSNNRTSQC